MEDGDMFAGMRRIRSALLAKVEAATLATTTTPRGDTAHLVTAEVYEEIEAGLSPGARWSDGELVEMEHLLIPSLELAIVKAWEGR